jgi:hypothetical protein
MKRKSETRRMAEAILAEFDTRMMRPMREIRASLEFIAHLKFRSDRAERLVAEKMPEMTATFSHLMFTEEQYVRLRRQIDGMKAELAALARRED